jgi:hypothetical protein
MVHRESPWIRTGTVRLSRAPDHEEWLCRIEKKRGGVQGRQRLKQATSFVVAFAEKSIAPFPLPAHRVG